jgi:hypothetical protein
MVLVTHVDGSGTATGNRILHARFPSLALSATNVVVAPTRTNPDAKRVGSLRVVR